MRQLVRGVCRLLHSWWRQDRIRVSPREGRLLGLPPLCLLLVAGTPARVVRRSVRQRGGGTCAVYHCVTRTGTARLEVELDAGGRQRRPRWRQDGRVRELAEDEVEVFPA